MRDGGLYGRASFKISSAEQLFFWRERCATASPAQPTVTLEIRNGSLNTNNW